MGALLKSLLLPPANCLALIACGWALRGRWPRLGHGLVVSAAAVLLLLSLPVVADGGLRLAAAGAAEPFPAGEDAGAIVVLGGDTVADAAAAGGATIGALSLERVRHAARLQRRYGKPILVTGGPADGARPPVAALMREALVEDFGAGVTWVEAASRDTFENARNSAPILRQAGIGKVMLVTHGWHMARAKAAFERQGIAVVAAPTRLAAAPGFGLRHVIPSATALQRSAYAMHEGLGRAYYAVAALWRD